MVSFANNEQLRGWLSEKPADWSRTIAVRAALRSLPIVAFSEPRRDELGGSLALPSFGSAALAWGAVRWGRPEFAAARSPAALTSLRGRDAVSLAPGSRRVIQWMRAAEAAYAAAAALRCAAVDTAFEPHYNAYSAAADAVANAVAASGDLLGVRTDQHDIWHAAEADVDLLERGEAAILAPLWAGAAPDWFERNLQEARQWLEERERWRVWLEWLQRRIEGSPGAFGISDPGDLAVLSWLAAQDGGFWDLSPVECNAALIDRIDWAKAEFSEPEPEPQNPIAIVFAADPDGRIDVDAAAGADEVGTDPDSQDRHAALRQAIEAALEKCHGNAAQELRERLVRLREALGNDVRAMRPSLVVLYGDAVREDVALRQKADPRSDVGPLFETAMLTAVEVVGAINMLIGLDPALERRDLVRRGPDASRVQATPEEVVQVLDHAEALSLLKEAARDALRTAVALAPAVPDVQDRRSRSLTESMRNLVRTVAQSLWRFTRAAGKAAAIPATLYAFGHFLLANEAIWLRWFADSPTMLFVIRELAAILRSLPLS